MRRLPTAIYTLAAIITLAAPAFAHHSQAMFDTTTEILVEGFQAKDGELWANGRDVTFADGRKMFVGSSGTGAPDERPEK